MPTVAREGAYRLVIHTRDHPPPHVHMKWGSEEVRINLLTLQPMDPGPLPAGGLDAVRAHLDALLRAWQRYHERK